MPTYAITAAAGRIGTTERAEIAKRITAIHHEETGAPKYLAQVVFYDVGVGSHFIGGEPAPTEEIYVYIQDIPAQSVIEWGRPLTAPGDEQAWLATLPPELQERLRRIG